MLTPALLLMFASAGIQPAFLAQGYRLKGVALVFNGAANGAD